MGLASSHAHKAVSINFMHVIYRCSTTVADRNSVLLHYCTKNVNVVGMNYPVRHSDVAIRSGILGGALPSQVLKPIPIPHLHSSWVAMVVILAKFVCWTLKEACKSNIYDCASPTYLGSWSMAGLLGQPLEYFLLLLCKI